jgi:hypothetical protein
MRGWGGWLCEWVYFLFKKKKNLTVVYLTTATSVGNKNSGKFSGSLAFLI